MTSQSPESDLNGLTAGAVREALLQFNFLPRQHDHKEELPPIFNSLRFTPEVSAKLANIKARKSGYDLLPFRRTRHPNIPRMMGIPHPRAYAQLVHVISENWEQLLQQLQSPNSQLEFKLHEDGRIIILKYGHVAADGDVEDQDPLTDFGKNYRVKTDINNFYHSIYSHSLPWALVGHDQAKRHKGPKHNSEWYNQIDKAVTMCQRCETKGIPIGPSTSNILSEIILYQVDAALREKYHFTRYIDDYTAFVDDRDQGDQFLIDLSRELERYALVLNLKKTSVAQMPVLNREEWITDINLFLGLDHELSATEDGKRAKLKFRQLKLIIDKAVALSKEFPDGSVIKYAFSAIIEIGIENEGLAVDDEAPERYFEDALLRYSYYYPTLIPLLQRWLPRVASSDRQVEHRVEKRVMQLLDRSFDLAQSDNIVWCIYYLLQMRGEPQAKIPADCCSTNDPMVVLMGYVYAKKLKLSTEPFSTWANSFFTGLKEERLTEYDLDQAWLVLYQLYYDGILVYAPYKSDDDNKIFDVLKAENVSFIDFCHDDFEKRASNFTDNLFGDL